MTTAIKTPETREVPDFDAWEADARRRISELTEQRAHLSLDALTDEAVRQELANIEAELGAARAELERVGLAREELARIEDEEKRAEEEKVRAAAAKRAQKLEVERRRSLAAIDKTLEEFGAALAAHQELCARLSHELGMAGEGRRDLRPSASNVQEALAYALRVAGCAGAVDIGYVLKAQPLSKDFQAEPNAA